MNQIRFLMISPFLPYDAAPYAGSKSLNYYCKKIGSDKDFSLKLLSIASSEEYKNNDLSKYDIDCDIACVDDQLRPKWFYLLYNWKNIPNYFGKTMGLIIGYYHEMIWRKLKEYKKQGYCPDVISLEWTQITLMVGPIKKIFPNAFILATEVDVVFQRYERQLKAFSGILRLKTMLSCSSVKKAELHALQQTDIVVTLNQKDRDILVTNGVLSDKIHVLSPWFCNYRDVTYNQNSKNMLFYGAMNRFDNYQSAIWFIEHVFNKLSGLTLTIVGSSPHACLEKYRSDSIVITGFVEDVRPYMQNSMCMVAPLVLGAGIKIKVLEGLSAGLPVLTNEIGIEGIPAKNGLHYFHCEKPEEYVAAINGIVSGKIDTVQISKNAKLFINDLFDMEKSYLEYKKAILGKIEEKSHMWK